jgi:serine/threonine protein kinase
MGCPAGNTLTHLVEGSLPGVEKAALLEHLDECGACRFVVAALARDRSIDGVSPTVAAPGTPATELARRVQVGRYVVVEKIGAGGMGVVYAAYDPLLDRKVAIKLLRLDWAAGALAEGRARLIREGQVMARLQSPNVITVLDVGSWGDRDFVAMELIDGCTLGQWLRQRPRTWQATLGALVEAGRGLDAAHTAGLVHRDFKPDNVLCSRAGRVLVTDFGLARLDGEGPAPVELPAGAAPAPLPATPVQTRSGALVGTPAYMAPEQLEGGPVDARSDQFSFCVTAFEALAGTRPFSGRSLPQLVEEMRALRPTRSCASPR